MSSDSIEAMLKDGWDIAGYSTTMSAQGTMMHSILLRKGTWLRTVTVGIERGQEVGRVIATL